VKILISVWFAGGNELLELGIEAWYGDISRTYQYIICEILIISEQLKCGDTADL
jgi:hypothetical protein